MPESFRSWLSNARPDLRALVAKDLPALEAASKVTADNQRVAYAKAIDAGQWSMLARIGRAELRARQRDIDGLVARQKRIVSLSNRRATLAPFAAHPRLNVTRKSDWPQVRKRIESELRRKLKPAQIRKGIAALEALNEKTLSQQLSELVDRWAGTVDSLADVQLAAKAGARLAVAVAAFNTSRGAGTSSASSLAQYCSGVEKKLASSLQAIWKALGNDRPKEAWTAAVSLVRTADAALANGGPVKAALAEALRSTTGTDSAQLGELTERFGSLLNALVRAAALGEYVAWLSHWYGDHPGLARWIAQAKKLKFPSAIARPPAQPVSALLANPLSLDGISLTVSGVLGPIRPADVAGKAVALTSVSAGGKSVFAVSLNPFLAGTGVAPGSYATASGKWMRKIKELAAPALILDHQGSIDAGAKSWSDWTVLELRHLYSPGSNALGLAWSWEPGQWGVGTLLRGATWFASPRSTFVG